MNNKLLSFAAAAASLLTIAACNKDDQKIDAITPGATTVYAKVSISMPKGTQTRALNADPGEEYEANVSNVILAFYDEAGVFVGEGALVGDGFEVESSDDNVSHKSENNICQIQLLGEGLPTQVVAFINAPDGYKDYKKNLTDLMTNGKVTLEANELYVNSTNNGPTDFVMTNSGYYGENGYIVATQLTDGMLFEAADEADAEEQAKKAEVTTIYVERLAAKIAVDAMNLENNPDYTIQDIKGEEVTLDFEATNWGATGIVSEENLVKYWAKGSAKNANNDAEKFRSYWAEGVFSSKPFEYYYADGEVAETNPLTYITYGDVDDVNNKNLTEVGKSNVIYVPEHTTELQIAESAKNLIANTYALIVGKYTVNSQHNDWYQNDDETDFYLLLAGLDENEKKVYTIYSKSQLIAYLLNFNGITKVGTSAEEITITTDVKAEDFDTQFKFTDYLDLKADPTTGKYVLAAGNTSLYYMNGDEAAEVKADDLQRQTNSRHFHYTKGHAYFNAPILHDGTFGGDDAIYGVVRNHSYVLNLTSVNSLGAPIDTDMHNPSDDEPIIPNPDELTDHWIKAEINVLSWNVKTSDVTL